MVDRINNAGGALSALRQLQTATRDLSSADSRLSSGLRVSKASEDANAFQAAAIMQGQGGSLNAVTLSLSRAESISDTAISGGEEAMKQLQQLRVTATNAVAPDLTPAQRQNFQRAYDDQMAVLQAFIRNATFDGANLLDGSNPNGVTFIADAEATQTLSLQGRDFTPGGSVIVAPASPTSLADPQTATSTINLLDQSIDNLGRELDQMGGERKRIETQKGFVSRLVDALAAGVGRMVDTDMAAESALIQALQVKQELSASAVSIANSAPQALLSLLRG